MEYFFGNPDPRDSDCLFLYDITKQVLHSALRSYYFKLCDAEPYYNDLPFEERYDFSCVYQECKRLLQEVFADSVVKSDNTHDLLF